MPLAVLYAKVPNEDQGRFSLVHKGNISQAHVLLYIGVCVPFPIDVLAGCGIRLYRCFITNVHVYVCPINIRNVY